MQTFHGSNNSIMTNAKSTEDSNFKVNGLLFLIDRDWGFLFNFFCFWKLNNECYLPKIAIPFLEMEIGLIRLITFVLKIAISR